MPKTIEAWTELYKFINFINLNDDEKLIVFGWRNNESVRKWMYSDDPISLDTHFKFIESLKSDESRSFLKQSKTNGNIEHPTILLVHVENDRISFRIGFLYR